MKNGKKENSKKTRIAKKTVVPQVKQTAKENPFCELDEPRWSVISFEKRIGKNLKYTGAAAMLEKLVGEKVSGLCIITDEAAEKMSGE